MKTKAALATFLPLPAVFVVAFDEHAAATSATIATAAIDRPSLRFLVTAFPPFLATLAVSSEANHVPACKIQGSPDIRRALSSDCVQAARLVVGEVDGHPHRVLEHMHAPA